MQGDRWKREGSLRREAEKGRWRRWREVGGMWRRVGEDSDGWMVQMGTREVGQWQWW